MDEAGQKLEEEVFCQNDCGKSLSSEDINYFAKKFVCGECWFDLNEIESPESFILRMETERRGETYMPEHL